MQMDPSRQEENAYRYATANPVNIIDPSGFCSASMADYETCMQIREQIHLRFSLQVYIDIPEDDCSFSPGVNDPAPWTAAEMRVVKKGLDLLADFWGGNSFFKLFTPVTIRKVAPWAEDKSPAMRPIDSTSRVDTPLIVLPTATFNGVAQGHTNNPISVLWGELYHVMDYNLSGKPSGAFEDPDWLIQHGCGYESFGIGSLPTGQVSVHSFLFGYNAGWTPANCWKAVSPAHQDPIIHSPANLAAGDPMSNYAGRGPNEDFAHTYQVLTQALIGGSEVCAPVNMWSTCVKSKITSSYVQPDPQFWIDAGRLLFFLDDARSFGAKITERQKPFWE